MAQGAEQVGTQKMRGDTERTRCQGSEGKEVAGLPLERKVRLSVLPRKHTQENGTWREKSGTTAFRDRGRALPGCTSGAEGHTRPAGSLGC